MIHAYLMKTDEEDEGEYEDMDKNNRIVNILNHGPNFQAQMFLINEMAKLNITVSIFHNLF